MHPSLVTNSKHFAFFREDYNLWKEAGFPSADPSMIPILEIFNKMDGVTTRFCCQGHEQGTVLRPRPTKFYILFGLTETGVRTMEEVYMSLCGQLYADCIGAIGMSPQSVSFSTKLMPFSPEEQSIFPKHLYQAFFLEARPTNDPAIKEKFLASLLKVIKAKLLVR